MKKLLYLSTFIFCSLLFASTVSAQCEGTVYIRSETGQLANSVHGFTSTELDYCASLYYDAADLGSFTEGYGTGFALIGEGYSQTSGHNNPARLDFDYYAPINNGTYTTSGNHYVIAYYQVYVPYWNDYFWYDPWNLGFGEIGGGYEQGPDYFGYFSYVTYWVASPQYVGSTVHTINYTGQTQCASGQQFTSTGQPCSNIPQCQTGQQFTTTGQLCPNYVPPVEPPAHPSVSVRFLDDSLRPAGTTGNNDKKNTQVETCVSGVSNPVGQLVNLKLINESSSLNFDGGHKEDFHKGKGTTKINRPLGALGRATGLTGADGCYRTSYTPPAFSGLYTLVSTILNYSNKAIIGVSVPNLYPLRPGENYRLIGGGPEDCNASPSSLFPDDCTASKVSSVFALAHPSNHWGVLEVIVNLPKIADSYKAQFYFNNQIPPAEMVTYNDMSLEWGGKFDLNRNWLSTGEHGEHNDGRRGIDTRSKNIPESRHNALMQLFNNFGFAIHDERFRDPTRPHWHLRWAYTRNGVLYNDRAGLIPLQNGIDQNAGENVEVNRTPSILVHNVGEAIFERNITQDEFEVWYPQMTNAKAQGLTTFLQEVKTFEKQLFASQEYIARQRTNDQFVQDVFASHLFREPTNEELSYWIGYLSNIGGTQEIVTDPTEPSPGRTRTTIPLNQTQRRQIFLNNFQTLPDFVNMVGSVVDDSYQEPPH